MNETITTSSVLFDMIRQDGEYGQLLKLLKTISREKPLPILVNGLCQGADDIFMSALVCDLPSVLKHKSPVLLLMPDEKSCEKTKEKLVSLGLHAVVFPCRDFNFYNITASHEFEHTRIGILMQLLPKETQIDVIIATPDATLTYTMPQDVLANNIIKLDKDIPVSLPALIRQLSNAGYIRKDMVDGQGQFSVRGGIIDIFPSMAHYLSPSGEILQENLPVRLELFGDDIDRMILFSPDSQRFVENISLCEMAPAREVLPDKDAVMRLNRALEARLRLAPTDEAKTTVRHELQSLQAEDGGELLFIDKYIHLVYPIAATLLDYMKENHVVLIAETNAVNDRIKAFQFRAEETVKELLDGGTIDGKYLEYNALPQELGLFLQKRLAIHVNNLSSKIGSARLSGIFTFRTRHTVSFCDNFATLTEEIAHYQKEKYRVFVTAESKNASDNLVSVLQDAGITASVCPTDTSLSVWPSGCVGVLQDSLLSGVDFITPRIAVLSTTPDEMNLHFSQKSSAKREIKRKKNTSTILSYADLHVGDYVVHETHGIGIYTGIEKIKSVDGAWREYIGIQYAGSDKLNIPIENMDRISKYIGAHADDGGVKLSKFGGDAWQNTKSRAKAAVKEMAQELIKLYAERMRRPGFAFPQDDAMQTEFEDAFPYEETDAQLNASADIKEDMEKEVPMDRLLCGDVGYGKTEVALRAAYKAVLGGKQVAILVPTTLLAMQHYQSITSRMRAFAVEVDMISRFRTAKQQELTLRRVKRGEVDILVGTHRMIGKDVEFKDLGLLIVDEEQRFGVAQKEKLKQMAPNVDVLTLTATPIPRTLNMAMSNIRDISILDEAPGDRQPVQTYVLEEDDIIIQDAIQRELHRGGQVFYLHNNVETIAPVGAKLQKANPDARIVVAHGQMEKEELEDIWSDMLAGGIDILVCTTIIETGVDIANANTLIVSNAHRLGLSQLHQLRGRVGRSSRRAYAYFTYPQGRLLTDIAKKRLEAIRDYAEFGAGFKIALRDMEIRGVGNLLGAEQHGHMDAVGYDLFIKLLEEAVLEEKGQKAEKAPECKVSLVFDALLPDYYVPSPAQRVTMYKKIALIQNEADLDDIADELLDRFGDLPREADNLLQISLIRAEAAQCHIIQIKQMGHEIHLIPSSLDFAIWSDVSSFCKGRLRAVLTSEPYLKFLPKTGDDVLRCLHKVFLKYLELQKVKETIPAQTN